MIPQARTRCVLGLVLVLALRAVSVHGEVRLPALFTDHMVLQRGAAVPVWGWADGDEMVTVEFRGHRARVQARHGSWQVRLPKLQPGGPDTLTVTGSASPGHRIDIRDVWVGEVWICSGQSNMEWPMRLSADATNAIAQASHPQIRLFRVPNVKSQAPLRDVKAVWQICTPQTAEHFSAVAYYFGRDLQRRLGVPIGLIQTAWGGSPAEVWMSEGVLAANPDYKRDILDPFPAAWKRYEEDLARFEKEEADARAQGRQPSRGRPWPAWRPGELYNGMIAPLIPYAIRGAIWYQGESNAGRAHQYRTLFPDMIRNWRRDWGQGDFPFLAVQLAPWDRNKKRSVAEITATPGDSDWAELRDAQVQATRDLPKVGLAIITDAGDKDDIHPGDKLTVGQRLGRLAGGLVYHQRGVYTGPQFKRQTARGDELVLSFSNVGGGLTMRGDRLTGFAICGEDHRWVWGDARIVDKQRVAVRSEAVPRPVAVRFGWSDFPVVNLFNQEGFPASPFRTDTLPWTTVPRR